MKKLFFLAAILSTMFVSCSDTATDDDIAQKNIKSSEIYIYSGNDQIGMTRAWNKTEELGYSIPRDGNYDVWYFIRIDGNIPGEPETGKPASAYFPQTTGGKTIAGDLNQGSVTANAPWHESIKKNFPKYIWGTDGTAVQSIITKEPTLEDIINANQNTKYNLQGYIENKDKLHFLWYTCKQQKADHIWHIDGILTTKERTDISETDFGKSQIDDYNGAGMIQDKGDVARKGHVEVDVHQQEHKDWNEIKTSIHLRDTVAVEVFLPIDYQELADDFNIRLGYDYEYVTELKNSKITIDGQVYEFKVNIKHEPTGIRILIEPNKEALIAARKKYEDGITFEVHSYITSGIDNATIWSKLKKTTVTTTPYTTKYGQITSAYYEDDQVLIK